MNKNWVAGLLMGAAIALALAPQAEARVYFKDNFNGHKINPGNWNTSIATDGNRWCSSTVVDHLSNPGQWVDVSEEPCHGYTEAPPYGNIDVSGRQISFSQGAARTFPYIWAGPPSRKSPFPETGDFVFETRMKFDSVQPSGSGLAVVNWENTEPTGDNPPVPFGGGVFNIWSDTTFGIHVNFFSLQRIVQIPVDPAVYHDFRIEYVDGKYSLYVDDVLRFGPVASSVRPNTIWLGNPVFMYWDFIDWTDFTIDSISVTVPKGKK